MVKPIVTLRANGTDISGHTQTRLISLSLTDIAGLEADQARITLDDSDSYFELPPKGARLEIALGLERHPTLMGVYFVDSLRGDISTMTIIARAADLTAEIKARRTATHQNTTLGKLIDEFAARHGLTPKCAPQLAGLAIAYRAQTNQSDVHFLTALARELDITIKPAGGALLAVPRMAGKSANGAGLPVQHLKRSDFQSYTYDLPGRNEFACICARWRDLDANTTCETRIGAGKPEKTLPQIYPNETEATRAAQAAYARAGRSGLRLSGKLAGFYPDLVAEGVLEVTGIKPPLCGKWYLERVTHDLRETLSTQFEATRSPKEKETP